MITDNRAACRGAASLHPLRIEQPPQHRGEENHRAEVEEQIHDVIARGVVTEAPVL